MKTNTMKCLIGTALAASLATAGAAHAGDSAAQAAHDRDSAARGLGRSSVALLMRRPGPGQEAAQKALLRDFGADLMSGAVSVKTKKAEGRHLAGNGWFLSVREDGTEVSYWNENELKQAQLKSVAVADRRSQKLVESDALEFIKGRLKGFVKLGAGEQLAPVRVKYMLEGSESAAGERHEAVVGAMAVFRRVVDGVNVIGPGSTVSVTYGNHGRVMGFRYDWSEYQSTGASQSVLDVAAIKARAGAHSAAPRDGKVDLERMNCGYFDMGASGRDARAPIQAACSFSYISKMSAGGKEAVAGLEEIFPAGVTVAPDAAWPEAKRVAGQGDVSQESPASNVLAAPPGSR